MSKEDFNILELSNNKLLDSLPQGIFFKNMDGVYLYCNKAFTKLVGFPKKELIGKKIEDYLGSVDLSLHHDSDKKLEKGEDFAEYVFELRDFRHKNALRFFKITKSLIKDAKGKKVGILGTLENVTDESVDTERYSLAVDGTDVGIWDWDIVSNDVFYSPSWKMMLGYNDDEIENSFKSWEKLMHPDDLDESMGFINNYLKGKIKGNFEMTFRMQHKDGHYVNILSKASLVKSDKGKPTRMIGSHINISQIKSLESSLLRFKDGFEYSSNSMVIVDYEDNHPRIKDVNKSFTRIYGYKEEEVLGKEPKELNSGVHSKEFYKKMWGDILNPKLHYWSGEIVNKRKDGSLVEVILTINSFFDKKGNVTGFIAHHTDISKLREHQEALEDKLRELEEFNSVVVGRELKMVELKKEIEVLKGELKGKK